MRILIVSSDIYPHIGGKSTHITDLSKALLAIDQVNVRVISLSCIPKFSRFLAKLAVSPLRLFSKASYVLTVRSVFGFLLNRVVAQYCKEHSVDVISAQDAAAVYFIRKTIARFDLCCVLTMHTYFGLEFQLDNNPVGSSKHIYNVMLKQEMSAMDYSKQIVAVDKRIEEHIKCLIASRKYTARGIQVSSIANFTDTDYFAPAASSNHRSELRHKYGIPTDKKVIICARRLVEKNGVINAVDAMSYFDDDKAILLVIGDGPRRASIEEKVSKKLLSNRVYLWGGQSREVTRDLFTLSDISVVPSITVNGLQEATSISAIEAMACGIPTIASNIGGLRQLITDEETGLLVEEGDSRLIADRTKRLLGDDALYTKISQNARQYIQQHHSSAKAAELYIGTYGFHRQKAKS